MSNTMTFRLNDSGTLSLVSEKALNEVKKPIREIKDKSIFSKLSEKSKGTKMYSFAPAPILLTASATANASGAGVFWDTFMVYIFPWMLDIAKVFCAIKIAQAFYQERRGGAGGGTGMEAIVTYGKWYLLFVLMPYGVQLIDELGNKMLMDLNNL